MFGKVVLGLSQGSVSEIMNKPKPWHMLSIKGREPYIRMQLWLSDPMNVEKLKQAKLEECQTIDLSRKIDPARASLTPSPMHQNLGMGEMKPPSTRGSLDKEEVIVDEDSTDDGPPTKRLKLNLSEEQKEALKMASSIQPFPNPMFLEYLSKELDVDSTALGIWFQAQRGGGQGQVKSGPGSEELDKSLGKEDEERIDSEDEQQTSDAPQSRSRRKAATPQWVNPDLASSEKPTGDKNVVEDTETKEDDPENAVVD